MEKCVRELQELGKKADAMSNHDIGVQLGRIMARRLSKFLGNKISEKPVEFLKANSGASKGNYSRRRKEENKSSKLPRSETNTRVGDPSKVISSHSSNHDMSGAGARNRALHEVYLKELRELGEKS